MTSASELPLSHDPPARHPSFLPLLCLSTPLDNLSLPLCIVLSFSSSSSFFVRLFSFSRLAPSGSRGASRREREREEGCTTTISTTTTTTTVAASNLAVVSFGGARRSKGTEAEKRGEKRAGD